MSREINLSALVRAVSEIGGRSIGGGQVQLSIGTEDNEDEEVHA